MGVSTAGEMAAVMAWLFHSVDGEERVSGDPSGVGASAKAAPIPHLGDLAWGQCGWFEMPSVA
jgi:hypothetical protein